MNTTVKNSDYKIGIDFDNTIICYDEVFNKVGIEKNIIPDHLSYGKNHVRNYLRKIGQEDAWIELQGYVYGSRLIDAYPFEGVKIFFNYCKKKSIDCCIISHKTLHPFRGYPFDLHEAAYKWLDENDFHCDIFFELTREEKVKRICQQGCTHFIDDLPEFLNIPEFPDNVTKILFDPLKNFTDDTGYENYIKSGFKVIDSWKKILSMLQKGIL